MEEYIKEQIINAIIAQIEIGFLQPRKECVMEALWQKAFSSSEETLSSMATEILEKYQKSRRPYLPY